MNNIKKITITDVTLREIQKIPNEIMTFNEKLQFVKIMEKLNPDCIECGLIGNRTDEIFIKTICETMLNTQISINVDLLSENINVLSTCLEKAKNPRINIAIPMLVQKMEYKYHKKQSQIIEIFNSKIEEIEEKFSNIEITLENAELADKDFILEVLEIIKKHKIKYITVQDSTGVNLYEAFKEMLQPYIDFMKDNAKYEIILESSDDYNIAIANYAYMLNEGFTNFKTSFFGNALPKTNEVCKLFYELIKGREDIYSMQFSSNSIDVKSTEIKNLLCISNLEKTNKNSKSPFLSNRKELIKNINIQDEGRLFKEYKIEEEQDIKEVYKLKSFVVNNSNVFTPVARVELICDNKVLEGFSSGNGPIDSVFKAIENVIGHHFELDDFSINSINEGRQASGACMVCLRYEAELYEGVGIDTDIVFASVKAFIMAINKIYSKFNL